jgi:3-hydroxyisobutyrate dehydrogenase-like beta-hydroxyacid dehydrogenase
VTSRSAKFFDAPVSGGTAGAEKATLAFMVGSTADNPLFPLLKTILSLMGREIVPCGGLSLGIAAKLCNNYCSSIITLATAGELSLLFGLTLTMEPF